MHSMLQILCGGDIYEHLANFWRKAAVWQRTLTGLEERGPAYYGGLGHMPLRDRASQLPTSERR